MILTTLPETKNKNAWNAPFAPKGSRIVFQPSVSRGLAVSFRGGKSTVRETNLSPPKVVAKNEFPFPSVGEVSSPEGTRDTPQKKAVRITGCLGKHAPFGEPSLIQQDDGKNCDPTKNESN